MEDALALDSIGVFAIVLECIPEGVARRITDATNVPTIGIGAGRHCNGQVLVTNDLLGLDPRFKPRFVKRYAALGAEVKAAVAKFREEVLEEKFPAEENTFH